MFLVLDFVKCNLGCCLVFSHAAYFWWAQILVQRKNLKNTVLFVDCLISQCHVHSTIAMKYKVLCHSLLFQPSVFPRHHLTGTKEANLPVTQTDFEADAQHLEEASLVHFLRFTHTSTACHLSLLRKGCYQLLHLTVTSTTVSWHLHLRSAQVDVANVTANFWAERINVSTGQADRPLALIIAAASHSKWQAPHLKIFLSIT